MLPSYHPSPYIVMPATFGPGKKGPSNLTPNTLILVLTRARTRTRTPNQARRAPSFWLHPTPTPHQA